MVEVNVSVSLVLCLCASGNGPSGICLSLLLSGYWPYFSGSHPNPVLQQKLNEDRASSLLEQVRSPFTVVIMSELWR